MFHEDRVLKCKECGTDFVFSTGEQAFYAEKGLTNEPSRCRECRIRRKEQRQEANRQLYDAVCSNCGVPTRVPFKPTGKKPIYCRDCMTTNRKMSYK
jgi:CxxC-x17-CxxC domain-containing protein